MEIVTTNFHEISTPQLVISLKDKKHILEMYLILNGEKYIRIIICYLQFSICEKTSKYTLYEKHLHPSSIIFCTLHWQSLKIGWQSHQHLHQQFCNFALRFINISQKKAYHLEGLIRLPHLLPLQACYHLNRH